MVLKIYYFALSAILFTVSVGAQKEVVTVNIREQEHADYEPQIHDTLPGQTVSTGSNLNIQNDVNRVDSGLSNVTEGNVAFSTVTRACRAYKFTFSVAITGTVCILGFLGNILVLFVMINYPRFGQKTSTPLLLGALAVSDLLVLVSVFMMKTCPSFCLLFPDACGGFMTHVFPYWEVYGWPSMDLAHAYSTWIIVVVTVHRYIAVCTPHRASALCTRSAAAKHLMLVITFCTLFELPVFLDFHLNVEEADDGSVTLSREYTALGQNYYYQIIYKTTLYYTVMYVAPFVLLVIFTTALIRTLKTYKRMQENTGRSNEKKSNRNVSKTDDITRTMIVLVLVFVACQPWEPTRRILEAIYGFRGCGHVYYYFEEFPSLSFAVNSAANFLVYTFCLMGTKFGDVLVNMLKCWKTDAKHSDDLSLAANPSTFITKDSYATTKGEV